MSRVGRRSRLAGAIVVLLGLLAACTGAVASSSPSRDANSAGSVVGSRTYPSPAASGSQAPTAAGTSVRQLKIAGGDRSYRIYRPQGLSGPAPLVLFLHGGFGSGAQAEAAYGWDAQADAGRFVVAYPDSLDQAWNAGGGCCGRPAAQGVDDVGFLTAVVRDIEARVTIDPDRVYATGMSNGVIMTYTLACRTDLFAAIGPVAATMLDPCPHPVPLSVIHVHGSADTTVRYLGGRGDGPAHIDGPAIPDLNATWRRIDGCGDPRVVTSGPVTTSTAACPDGRAVELITVAGAGHQWPGSAKVREGADPPSTALDATSTIWRFFAGHHR